MVTAKDLWIPCTWETRKPILMDKFFYVPQHYDQHQKSKYRFFLQTPVFSCHRPIHIEYCSGNGSWIIQKAASHPDINWVAVEMRFDRARKIWVKMQNQKLDNLFVVYGKAETFNQQYLEDEIISVSYINFPDPWPKKKHAKHRIFQEDFMHSLYEKTKKNGKVVFVTDDPSASEQMIENTLLTQKWKSSFASPHFIENWPDYGTSYFEALWKDKRRTIRYMQFEK